MLVGNLSNNNGVIMEMAAVKKHIGTISYRLNIYDFFKNYEHDTLTGEYRLSNYINNVKEVVFKTKNATDDNWYLSLFGNRVYLFI